MQNQSAAFVLMNITDHVRTYHDRMEAQMLRSFVEIARRPEISVKDLAEASGCSGAAASRNITKLGPGDQRGEGLGLVHRYEDPSDRRNKRVTLTDRGQRFFAELANTLDEALQRINHAPSSIPQGTHTDVGVG